ncbi:hypothetical protein E3T61_21030 [Cryobacterium lactosi]|uniref:Helix-turn-helix domain-containing protein n=1 Tax=Cryobacterium lactosi TaxID=1259202 RepID=A0A4R9BGE2_9MICO|nr:hypothetical protein [Cryobacterium lactosi]TFD83522.1 hypothetical protein E3T61_21030 [Cryobacterium lactosi]
MNALAEKEIVRIRAQSEKNTADRRASAARTIGEMLTAGASRTEVAGRLGIATRDVKRAAPVLANPVGTVPAGSGLGDGSDQARV